MQLTCISRLGNLCCKQINNYRYIPKQHHQTKLQNLSQHHYKSSNVIYLLEFKKCNLQYISGKLRRPSTLDLTTTVKSKQTRDVIPVSAHFNMMNHNFNRDLFIQTFTLIDTNTKQ